MKPIIEINKISKKYRINKGNSGGYMSIRDSIVNLFSRNKNKAAKEDFWALKDVSFEVFPGESVGIIGKNGAGKSTLLKILSKITPPTSGKIISRGRIASLLEVGTGFHPELTGRENIYLNGSILGLKHTEIKKQFDAIVDFSGTEKFLDTPLKHFSSGMQLRLAFSVAAHLEPEILIIDEVLAVGDSEFQKKCLGKMNEVSKSGRTLLFVSHQMGSVKQLCNKAVLLSNGGVNAVGNVGEIIHQYNNLLSNTTETYFEEKNKDIYIKEISVLNAGSQHTSDFLLEDDIYIRVKINSKWTDSSRYILLVTILDSLKRKIFSDQVPINKNEMTLKVNRAFLTRGYYSVQALIYIPAVEVYDEVFDCCEFKVLESGSKFSSLEKYDYGVVFGNTVWV